MKKTEVKRFTSLYERHLKLLKLQGKSKNTIYAYSRAVAVFEIITTAAPTS